MRRFLPFEFCMTKDDGSHETIYAHYVHWDKFSSKFTFIVYNETKGNTVYVRETKNLREIIIRNA